MTTHPSSSSSSLLPPSLLILRGQWYEFISLGLPGTVMLCSEWWAFEFLTIMATFLGTAAVDAETIVLQICSLSFMIPLGR